MALFTHEEFDHHEKVSFFHDQETGLKAIIAIHNSNLGPALGGCRMWDYATSEEALTDVLRLSRGMSYKSALAGLPLGGGKSVIIGDARKIKTADLMRAMGRAVDSLGGAYIIAEDVGSSVQDMVAINEETDHVVGLPAKGDDVGGDPSPLTAYGVYVGLKTAAFHKFGVDTLKGLKVSVQGVGNVGYHLCKLLHKDGAELFITDVHQDSIDRVVEECGATVVGLDEIYDLDVDIYAPCALGGTVNDETLPRLKAKVIAGAANNQLKRAKHGDALVEQDVLYAPDYVINAGGVINVYYEYNARQSGKALKQDEIYAHIDRIADTMQEIIALAEQKNISMAKAADELAEARFQNKTVSENGVAA